MQNKALLMRRVVITGMGAIAPSGKDLQEFWDNSKTGTSAIAPIPEEWKRYSTFQSDIWAPLPEIDYSECNITRIEAKQLDPIQLLTLGATKMALEDAQIVYSQKDYKKNTFSLDGIDPHRSGISLGTGIGGMHSNTTMHTTHMLTPLKKVVTTCVCKEVQNTFEQITIERRFNPYSVSMVMPNASAAQIGIKYGLQGKSNTHCSACAAGTVALGNAFQSIRNGELDVMISGGVEHLGEEYGGIFRGFDIAKTLVRSGDDPSTANRPFDANRSGFLFAEGGAGILILEEYEHAISRGAPIYAEIIGYGETFDAHSIMSLEPTGIEIERAIQMACDDAHIGTDAIDYINTHGTGTEVNDATEAAVIKRVFGSKPLVNATKSITGHTIGAAGALEAIVTARSLSEGVVHGCANLENPIEDLNFVRETKEAQIEYALSQSFAFGGHNAALVLKKA